MEIFMLACALYFDVGGGGGKPIFNTFFGKVEIKFF
jgi:hypothetical protein